MQISSLRSSIAKFDCTIIVLTKDNPRELISTLESLSTQAIDFEAEIIIVESWANHTLFVDIVDKCLTSLGQFSVSVYRLIPAPGIYSSMNYALSVSSGDSLVFLNSGDTYACFNSLSRLYYYWRSLASSEASPPKAVFSQAFVHSYGGHLRWKTPFFSSIKISKWLFFSWPCHQSLIFDGCWARNHPYRVDMGISADQHVILAALQASKQSSFYPYALVNYFLNGASSQPPSINKLFVNFRRQTLKQNAVNILKFVLTPIWFLYPMLVLIKSFLVALVCL